MSFTKPNIQMCKSVFEKIDTDKSNVLDIKEICTAFSLLGVKLGESEIQGIMNIIDQDGNGHLGLDEFTHLVYVCQNTKPSDLPRLLFLTSDKDYSSKVDADELYIIFNKLGAELTKEEAVDLAKNVSGREDGEIDYE